MFVLVSFVKDDHKDIVEIQQIRSFDPKKYDKTKKYNVFCEEEEDFAEAFIVGVSEDLSALEKLKLKRFSRPAPILAKSASDLSDLQASNDKKKKSKVCLKKIQII